MGIFNMILGISLIQSLLQLKSSALSGIKCNLDFNTSGVNPEFQINFFL